jgi:hypothetical protein
MHLSTLQEQPNESSRSLYSSHGSLLARVSLLVLTGASLIACCSVREITADTDQFESQLDNQAVVVVYFPHVTPVRQVQPDLCWAASLEQALVHQGVAINQLQLAALVQAEAGTHENPPISLFWWHQLLVINKFQLASGTPVYARCDIDGDLGGVILLSATMAKRLAFEVLASRIPLVGISTGNRRGHVMTVIGAAFPANLRRFTPDDAVGFLLYDPLTTKSHLESTEQLWAHFGASVYVTTYATMTGAAASNSCSGKAYF